MDGVDQLKVGKSRDLKQRLGIETFSLPKDLMCYCVIVFQYLYNFYPNDLWPNERNFIRTSTECDHAFVVTFIKNLNQIQTVKRPTRIDLKDSSFPSDKNIQH